MALEKYRSTDVKLPEEVRIKISTLERDAMELQVQDTESLNQAKELILAIKDLKKCVEDERIKIVKPLNEALRNINNMFKKFTEPLLKADGILSEKILAFNRAEQERVAKEQEKLEKKLQREEQKLKKQGIDIALPRPQIESQVDISTRKVIKWRVKDFSKVPEEYKMLDEVKITKAVRAGLEIPGIEIYEEEILIRR